MSIDLPNAECGQINKPWFKKSLFSLFSSSFLPPPPLTFPRHLALTFFKFHRLHGFKASVHLGYVPSPGILRHYAILGIERRV